MHLTSIYACKDDELNLEKPGRVVKSLRHMYGGIGNVACGICLAAVVGGVASLPRPVRQAANRLQGCLSGHPLKAEDLYEDKEVVFLKSNDSRNDALSDNLIEAAREALQPHSPFGLEDWQLSAGASILADRNVIVCAPTG